MVREVSDPISTFTGVIGKQAGDPPAGINEFPETYGLKGCMWWGQITMKEKKALTDSAASLQSKDKVRALTCDSPQMTVVLQRTAAVPSSSN